MDLRTQYIVDKFQNKIIPECNSFEEMKRSVIIYLHIEYKYIILYYIN